MTRDHTEEIKLIFSLIGRNFSLGDLEFNWKSFVSQCISGYDADFEEYGFDLIIRDNIDKILSSASIRKEIILGDFEVAVAAIDNSFRQLILAGPQLESRGEGWWRDNLPSFGGSKFVESVWNRFGISIESVGIK